MHTLAYPSCVKGEEEVTVMIIKGRVLGEGEVGTHEGVSKMNVGLVHSTLLPK